MIRPVSFKMLIPGLAILPLLGGCPTPSGTVDETGAVAVAADDTNSAPVISGTPPAQAQIGESYSYRPDASDPDGDSLTFSIENKPSWAGFDTATGTLSGMPALGTSGSYAAIRIIASDGNLSAATPQFSVEVVQTSLGSVTLSWTPPTTNTDGTPLMDLAAYRLYYGTSRGTYDSQVTIDNPGITTYVVDNLPPNTYYFVSTAVNANGIESDYSSIATKIVN